MNNEKHWAWFRPLEEFFPLGDKKLFYLIGYISKTSWGHDSVEISNDELVLKVMRDRKLASQIYTAYKKDVDDYGEQYEKQAIELEKTKIEKTIKKSKKVKSKKIKETTKETNNVINFSEFKKRKAS